MLVTERREGSRYLGADMSNPNSEYFRKRASVEKEHAEYASSPRIAGIHLSLARKFGALVRQTVDLKPS